MQLVMLNDDGKPVGILTGSPEEIIGYQRLIRENQFTPDEVDNITDALLDAIIRQNQSGGEAT